MPSVLLLGATGLVGAHLAADIKRSRPDWPLTAFYRNQSADEYFSRVYVDRIVHGSFSDTDLVKSLSKEHDIVINAASSFDADLINLIISGMEERPSTSPKGTLIHLSGTGNFIDYGTTGNFNPESKVWNDDNEEDIKLINKDMFNGATDVPVLEAGQRGKIATYIICLAVTSGQSAFGPTAQLGVGYNIFVGLAKGLGFVPYVGDGTGVVSTVHVQDAVPFITKIVGVAGTQEPQGSAYSRYYIVHGERFAWKDFSGALAKVLYTKGLVSSPEPKKISMDEAGVGEVKHLIAANMLVKGDHAARMGFKPVQPSMLVSMQKDIGEHVF